MNNTPSPENWVIILFILARYPLGRPIAVPAAQMTLLKLSVYKHESVYSSYRREAGVGAVPQKS